MKTGMLALCSAMALAASAEAQTSAVAVSLNYGVMEFDLSGVGTTRMWAARAEGQFHRYLVGEASLSVARPAQQFGDTTTFVVPEVQIQGQRPLGRVAPYLGAGIGIARDFRGGNLSDKSWFTMSVAGGVRGWFTDRWGMRAELRVRGLSTEFTGSTAEWTAGVSFRP